MSTTVTTTALGTSNLRGSSSKTRNLPARTSRNPRTSLRQNSLLSIPTSAPGAQQPEPEPHGFYPAITHFTDAITALPRDFRRHTSLLKEVDAKAWALEENLQKLLQHCLHERQTRHSTSTAQTVAGSVSSVAGDVPTASAPGSFVGNVLDTASQYSIDSGDADTMRRRRLYAELRNNLMQMIMPLDEKNHVINNANEELSRHIRRQDEIWPHIADEISEETRLGSLRHWALVDLNPTKKTLAAAARGREAALLDNNEVAERSERRREAMALAKKQKTALQQDSDVEARKATRKGGPGAKKVQETEDALTGANNLVAAAAAMTKTASSRGGANKALKEAIKNAAARGGVSMSRENSQQETTKKRKAATAAAAPARKRLNATTQESPKLAHSPLAATFSKEVHKKSPALSHAKPANGRSRQVSTQVGEASNRPSSSASRRNGVTVAGTEFDRATATTGKTKSEVKNTMKETTNARGEKMLEENVPDSVDNRIKGGILLERSGSKQGQLRREAAAESTGRRTVSPRLNTAALAESNKNGKSRAPRSTPQLGTFIDDTGAGDSSQDAPTSAGTENGNDPNKLKRPARPRMKDHHGLHDSLSPKGLPTKRHKKNASYSLAAALTSRASRDEGDERPIPTSMDRKGANSRTGSRSTKQDSRDGGTRHASSTPKIGGPDRDLVDEPEEMPDTKPTTLRKASSRRTSHARQHSLDVKPPSTNATHKALHNATSASAQMSPILKAETPLGSPGPAEDQDQDDQDLDETLEDQEVPDAPALPTNISQGPSAEDEEDEEDDPNEARYCYCNGVSYGEMVACDNEDCVREWFHLECTGLRALPPARSTWYCDECKGNMAR